METTGIMARATELAEQNTPGVAFTGLGVLLENLFLGFFAAIGWVIGRAWWLLFVVGLAFADGYKKGRGVKAEVPPVPPQQPQRPSGDLMDDDRIIEQYQTPFGVPFGPNVHASHG